MEEWIGFGEVCAKLRMFTADLERHILARRMVVRRADGSAAEMESPIKFRDREGLMIEKESLRVFAHLTFFENAMAAGMSAERADVEAGRLVAEWLRTAEGESGRGGEGESGWSLDEGELQWDRGTGGQGEGERPSTITITSTGGDDAEGGLWGEARRRLAEKERRKRGRGIGSAGRGGVGRERSRKAAIGTAAEEAAALRELREAARPTWWGAVVTTPEAAAYLGIRVDSVRKAIEVGKLNGWKEDGRWLVMLDDVERYRGMQRYWEQCAGGARTAYGVFPKKGPREAYERRSGGVGELGSRGGVGSVEEYAFPDREIGYWEAAGLLQVSEERVGQLAREKGLGLAYRVVDGRRMAVVSLHAVMRLAAEREGAAFKRGISPKKWFEGPTMRPWIRATLEAAEGDTLIAARTAAAMLEVHVSTVYALVRKGRLFGFQEQPGRQGVPLFLSWRQVARYAADPVRLKKREAQKGGSGRVGEWERGRGGELEEEEEGVGGVRRMRPMRTRLYRSRYAKAELPSERAVWIEWHGLWEVEAEERGRHAARDRGEFFTMRQAAEVMGVTPGTVRRLVRRGRLPGWRRPALKREGRGAKWWFVRKDAVYALMADREYCSHRRRQRSGNKPAV